LHGSVRSAVFLLALPVLGEQLLSSFVGMYDMFLAGTIWPTKLSAVGFASYVDWLVIIVFGLVGAGATALVARAVGMGDRQLAQRTTNQAISLGLALGAMAAVGIYACAPVLGAVLGLRGEALAVTTSYLRIVSVAHLATAVTLTATACLRGAGDTVTPMLVLGLTNVVNVVVSSLLVLAPGPLKSWGFKGIAVGTVVARLLGVLVILCVLIAGRSGLRLRLTAMHPHIATVRRILRVGVPALLDGLVMWFGHYAFMMIITRMGSPEESTLNYAAHIIGIRIESLTYLPAMAWSIAAATLVGQGLGARDPQRARRAGHEAARQGTALIVLVGVMYFVFAPQLYQLFTLYEQNPDVVTDVEAIGVPALRLLAFFQPALALVIIYVGALRGAGDTRYPLLFTLLGITFVRLPLAYLCGHVLDWGLVGAWIGMCGDLTLRATLLVWRFTRGNWEKTRV